MLPEAENNVIWVATHNVREGTALTLAFWDRNRNYYAVPMIYGGTKRVVRTIIAFTLSQSLKVNAIARFVYQKLGC